MELTREIIQKRIDDLARQKKHALDTAQAVDGAMQDCAWWLEQVDVSEKSGSTAERSVAVEVEPAHADYFLPEVPVSAPPIDPDTIPF